jgi:uncharacterized membrane protein YgdD (TMEM256/DUF423 family)
MTSILVKIFTIAGGLAGCAGVVLGALSAHLLKQRIEPAGLATLETVSAYLLIHGLLLVVIGALAESTPGSVSIRIAGVLAAAGIILFCGGLSVSVLSGVRVFATAAPAGGIALMGAWLSIAVYALSKT